jgi:hypothetical protein
MDDALENTQFASFERFDEFMKLEETLLAFDCAGDQSTEQQNAERQVYTKLVMIVC